MLIVNSDVLFVKWEIWFIYIRPYAPADKNIIACPAIPKPTGSRRFLRLSV